MLEHARKWLHLRRWRQPGSEGGFGLVDQMVATAVIGLTAMGFVGASLASRSLEQDNRALSAAVEMSRQVLGQMQSTRFSETFARFNADPADDPEGEGTASGASFIWKTVEFLALGSGRGSSQGTGEEVCALPTEMSFQIDFPVQNNLGVLELREDLNRPDLGLPRDLDGDGVITGVNVAGTYTILPVLIRTTWQSVQGPRTLTLATVLSRGNGG